MDGSLSSSSKGTARGEEKEGGGGGERRRRVGPAAGGGRRRSPRRTREAVGALDDALARLAEEDADDALARVLGDPVIVVDHREEDERVDDDPLGRDGRHLGGSRGRGSGCEGAPGGAARCEAVITGARGVDEARRGAVSAEIEVAKRSSEENGAWARVEPGDGCLEGRATRKGRSSGPLGALAAPFDRRIGRLDRRRANLSPAEPVGAGISALVNRKSL